MLMEKVGVADTAKSYNVLMRSGDGEQTPSWLLVVPRSKEFSTEGIAVNSVGFAGTVGLVGTFDTAAFDRR
eukprot:m.339167 g.339167  ORF g.339167 m.339167 type:complete len:71 (+) comp19815_c0_seq24:466-678(+)